MVCNNCAMRNEMSEAEVTLVTTAMKSEDWIHQNGEVYHNPEATCGCMDLIMVTTPDTAVQTQINLGP